MKKFLVLSILIITIFISCFETEEKIVINADKSGVYHITMNMSGLMSQMQSLTGKEMDTAKMGKKDTVIYFKDFTDTATVLSTEEKEMLHDGLLSVHIDSDSDEMKFVISVPFKNVQELPKLKNNLIAALDKAKMTKQLLDEQDPDAMEIMGQKGPDAALASNPIDSAFLWSIEGNTIKNKMRDSSMVAQMLSANSNLQSFKQIAPLFGDITYKTTYVLPSPVKNYKGSNTWISDDKKTISFTTGLTDLFDHPSMMEYELSY